MGKVVSHMTMSLDGFIANPDDDPGELFEWYGVGGESVDSANDDVAFDVDASSADALRELTEQSGALIAGRRLFDMTDGWGDSHPIGAPVVVVTHHPPAEAAERWPKTTFVDSVEAAVTTAKDIAGDQNVVLASPNIIQQALDLGLVDEVVVSLVPVLFGEGIPYFAKLNRGHVMLDDPVVVQGQRALHLRYPVPRRRRRLHVERGIEGLGSDGLDLTQHVALVHLSPVGVDQAQRLAVVAPVRGIEAVRLLEVHHCVTREPLAVEVLGELEVRGREPELGRTRSRPLDDLCFRQHVAARFTVCSPVAHRGRVAIGVGHVDRHLLDDPALTFRHLRNERRLVLGAAVARLARRERDLRGTDDGAVLVDPDRERRVGHAEQADQYVRRIHQRRMRGLRDFVERTRRFDVSVERNRDDLDAGRCELFVQGLPPGQVEATPSP